MRAQVAQDLVVPRARNDVINPKTTLRNNCCDGGIWTFLIGSAIGGSAPTSAIPVPSGQGEYDASSERNDLACHIARAEKALQTIASEKANA